jgi:hypothetical protein
MSDIFLLGVIGFGLLVFSFLVVDFIEIVVNITFDLFSDLFTGNTTKKEVPKKIFPPKNEYVQSLIKVGKANRVSAPHFIEDNFEVRSRLTFKNHEEKCKFLSLCDVIEQRDGFITDFEVVNLLSATNKIKI